MMRAWLAVALLAGSWLLGLGYFDPVNMTAWACMLVASVLLLADMQVRLPGLKQRLAILILLAPAMWFTEVPQKGIVVLMFLGIAGSLAPAPALWMRRLAHGFVLAALILASQALVLIAYQIKTARAHELPATCADWLAGLTRFLGADAAVDGSEIVLRSASATVRIGATWELLMAPGTACFAVGGCLLLFVIGTRRRLKFKSTLRKVLTLLLLCAAWAPLRAALLMTVVLQQRLRATPTTFLNVGETLVSSWVHIILLISVAAIAGVLLKPTAVHRDQRRTGRSRRPSALYQWCATAACILGVALLTFVYFWAPLGPRKDGRIMFVERHSAWEPTTTPYRTSVYGEAGSYNYAAIYEYSSQYYHMSRLLEHDTLDDKTLEQCDVLIIKTPTSQYSPEEVAAVVRFVQQGGSLLMIGDHTNVFNMNTYLNDISRHFGFSFRNDLLFQIGDPYRQRYEPPAVRHPILQYMPPMDFAVSCSIDPGTNRGTMVIRNAGLYNLQAAYHESNYHPQAEYRPHMQYGAWCQLWATTHGKGRVAAFGDSTLFSNFCAFQPGKSELFIGMLEWLNHSSAFESSVTRRTISTLLVLVGAGLAIIGCYLMRGFGGGWLLLLAAGAAGWALSGWLVVRIHANSMPLPPKHQSMPHVVIDRTVSTVPLFTGAFADDAQGNGYGMLEQWIPRLGNYISRRAGQAAFQGDGLTLICPTKLPSQQYREDLVEWVRAGGQLVVFDSPDVESSTANSILMLFGISSAPGAAKPPEEEALVQVTHGSSETPLSMSCVISGGTPLATWGEATVAARTEFGEGTVTAIGFGSLFNDANMGYHWLQDPDEELLQRYEVLYALLRAGLQN